MKWLGSILLIGVFARHDLTWLPGYTPPEWFYVLGGFWEIVLCSVILIHVRHALAVAAMWIGIIEGGQVAVCGAVIGHRRAPAGMNDCDFLTGWPIGFLMTFAELGIVVWAIAMNWPSARRS